MKTMYPSAIRSGDDSEQFKCRSIYPSRRADCQIERRSKWPRFVHGHRKTSDVSSKYVVSLRNAICSLLTVCFSVRLFLGVPETGVLNWTRIVCPSQRPWYHRNKKGLDLLAPEKQKIVFSASCSRHHEFHVPKRIFFCQPLQQLAFPFVDSLRAPSA